MLGSCLCPPPLGPQVPGMLLLSPHLSIFLSLSIKVPKARSRIWGCSVTWRVDTQTPSGKGREFTSRSGVRPEGTQPLAVNPVWSPDPARCRPGSPWPGVLDRAWGGDRGCALGPAGFSFRCHLPLLPLDAPAGGDNSRTCSPPNGHHELSVGSGRGGAAAADGATAGSISHSPPFHLLPNNTFLLRLRSNAQVVFHFLLFPWSTLGVGRTTQAAEGAGMRDRGGPNGLKAPRINCCERRVSGP